MSLPRALAAIAVLALVAGCSPVTTTSTPLPSASTAPTAEASLQPVALPTLLTVEVHGGLCPDGECRNVTEVDADGTVREVLPRAQPLGTVPLPLVGALRFEMERANFGFIQARPFTGECPTAYDGQEAIYTFHLSTGDERVASCSVAIDPQHPLFRAVDAVLTSARR
jgi:hypothetical protein